MSSSGEPQSPLQQSGTFGTGTLSNTTRVLGSRYELHKKLGSGNFGTAYLVKDIKAPAGSKEEWKVAKQMSIGDIAPDETVDAIKEGRLLSKLNHPGIVKFFDSFFDNELFCIVTEYCEGGDLKTKIADAKKKNKTLEESVVLDWFVQLMLAVEYIHNRRILHRDLTTGNVFLKNDMIKLGDFGISRVLMGTCDMASTFTGTPYYMSPEVLKHDGYNSKSDIWSVGCILYELCTLNHAFEGQGLMGVMYKIVEGEIPKLPPRFSAELNEIYIKILTRDIHKRPSATEILQIPFMSAQIERLKTQLEVGSAGVVNQKATNEQLEKEARDISQLINEPAHLEDLRRTLGFTSEQPFDNTQQPAVATGNDGTVKASPKASGTIKAEPTATAAAAASTIKARGEPPKPVSPVEEVISKPSSGNQKPIGSAGKGKVATTAAAAVPKAGGPVVTSKTPRLKTAAGSKAMPAPIKREQTQMSVKASSNVAPEDVAAAEAEFMRSLKQARESGGFKATYETSDQLKAQANAPNRSTAADSYDADAGFAPNEEEEYRQAYEAQKTYGLNNLSPKQLMLLRKKSEADRKAHELKQVTHENYVTQRAVKDGIRDNFQGPRRSVVISDNVQVANFSDYNNNNSNNDGNGQMQTVVQRGQSDFDQQQRRRFIGDGDLLSRSMVRDDRPITPMKKDVYKEASKELEFQNGVPVNPQIADFYYSYYDEFEDSEDSGGNHHVPMASQTVREFSKGPNNSKSMQHSPSAPAFANANKNQRIRFVSQESHFEGGNPGDERAELANYMATVLTRPSLPSRSITFVDDDSSHQVYGPQVRQSKIKAMRTDCERKLGPVKFRQVYDYLKDARSGNGGDGNETRISNDLRRMLGNTHDAFLVDQLLFLETMQGS